MLSRALSLATVTLLIGCFAAAPALGQATNLEAGKSPSQIFAGTCTACHKSPRGLLKSVPGGSLQSFLRQHYTTSPEMASLLSAFLVSNGAADTRYGGADSKQGKDAKSEAKPDQLDRFGRRVHPGAAQEAAKPQGEPQQAARPDEGGLTAAGRKRLARPAEAPDGTRPVPDGQTPAVTASERGPDGRKLSAKQRLSKRGKPGIEEMPQTDTAKSDSAKTDAAKTDAAKEETPKGEEPKSEASKDEGSKPEGSKPSVEGRPESQSAKVEPSKDSGGEPPALRPDPVPPVTPASPAAPAVSAAVTNSAPEPPPAAAPPSTPSTPQAPPPAVTASVPPPEPVAPAGPPAPPISQ